MPNFDWYITLEEFAESINKAAKEEAKDLKIFLKSLKM
jgi:hypothetical protein